MSDADVVFDLYATRMKISRWLILTTVLLSSLILVHVYLERFSYQDFHLRGILAQRMQSGSKENHERLRASLLKQRPADERLPDYKAELERFANSEYLITVTDNTLNNAHMESRELPLLGMKIPLGDYTLVMGMMLMIFVIAVWLNLRSVSATINALLEDQYFRCNHELIRLHFTFTGLVHVPPFEATLAKTIRFGALTLPALSFAIALFQDCSSLWTAIEGTSLNYYGPLDTILWRLSCMTILFILILIFSVQNVLKGNQIARMAST